MSTLGEDVAEVLEYVPGRFQVVRHVRPKLACQRCDAITQAPAPALPIPRGKAGPGLLAHVLVSKYADHLPLYRQAEIYAREGVDLDRSTMADWVGQVKGGERAAAIYTLIQTARLNFVDPEAWLRDVLIRIADGHLELLPVLGPPGWRSSSICRQRRAMCR